MGARHGIAGAPEVGHRRAFEVLYGKPPLRGPATRQFDWETTQVVAGEATRPAACSAAAPVGLEDRGSRRRQQERGAVERSSQTWAWIGTGAVVQRSSGDQRPREVDRLRIGRAGPEAFSAPDSPPCIVPAIGFETKNLRPPAQVSATLNASTPPIAPVWFAG